jgi:hypothetical protein
LLSFRQALHTSAGLYHAGIGEWFATFCKKSVFMKKILSFLIIVTGALWAKAQIVTPTVVGKFGVDGEVQMNMRGSTAVSCTDCDDWFYKQIANGGSSTFVIDTTGAGAIVASYLANPANTNIPFYRKMRYDAYSNDGISRTYIDAVFVRDYHNDNDLGDQTVFGPGSNKNGMSPVDWRGMMGGIPQKNDILDVFVHIRREGPTLTASDPLFMYGALACDATNGDRYFDFEMYQTDIFYSRSTGQFTGYGPDAGHTAWRFDASGNVTQPGDIVFSAHYNSSNLSAIEARIWTDVANLSVVPATFNWGGTYDGASNSSQYVYATIVPKNGATFYYGTENSSNTWAGPFRVARGGNTTLTQYGQYQLMEFGVNLSVLGLDPVTLLGKTQCGIPFSRVLVKTRASNSFTSELQDFIGPYDFFLPPQATAAADVPVMCGSTSTSNLQVVNPYPTSSYVWNTPDGHIVGSNSGTSITVDQPGTYTVTQILDAGCPTYASDTVTIAYEATCTVLASNQINLKGVLNNRTVDLNWAVSQNQDIKSFTIEKSTDGIHFTLAGTVDANSQQSQHAVYQTSDDLNNVNGQYVYYRIKISGKDGSVQYSKVVKIALTANGVSTITLFPNPVKDVLNISIASNADKDVQVLIYDVTGKLMKNVNTRVLKGFSTIGINDLHTWARGVYTVKVLSGKDAFVERMVLTK